MNKAFKTGLTDKLIDRKQGLSDIMKHSLLSCCIHVETKDIDGVFVNVEKCEVCVPYEPKGICAPMQPIGSCINCGNSNK